MDIRHPAAREEQAHLTDTLAVVAQERQYADAELEQSRRQLDMARRFDQEGLPLREMLFSRARQLTRELALASQRPYFTRVDFIPSGGEMETHYIGRWGVMRSRTLDVVVSDWRSPVANLYYSGQVGPMHYEAPDGRVEGELTLKRQLTVEDGELKAIFDTGVASRDAYLQSVLGAMTGDRLKDIVTTIQAEQNFVIRHPLSRNLVVQGAAGSGKTTIALHRIAYLLYAFSQRLTPERLLILAPNPLFLGFISGVLPDLGVENVRESTFLHFLEARMGSALPKLWEGPPSALRGWRGSLDCVRRLDAFLDDYERRFPPEGVFKFGPALLFSPEQTRAFLLEAEKPFPLERRKKEFQKELTRRLKEGLAQTLTWLDGECDRRSDLLEKMTPPGQERAARMRTLFQSRDARKEEAREKAKTYVKTAMQRFAPISPSLALSAFWESLKDEPGLPGEAARDALALGKPAREDAALLGLCDLRLSERPRLDISHIVVDEAQDFSCAEFELLRRMMPQATFTVVGDLMQGIRAWRGISDWADVAQGVFGGACVTHRLVTSYRSTVEIMELALRCARRHPAPGQGEVKPVLRHGPAPHITPFRGPQEQKERMLETARTWEKEGMKSIAVVARDTKEARALAKLLDWPLLDVEKDAYEAGRCVAEAGHVKGFEFDGVMVSDAGEGKYADTPEDARLLFVVLTRPLHRMAVFHSGPLTPLLAESDS